MHIHVRMSVTGQHGTKPGQKKTEQPTGFDAAQQACERLMAVQRHRLALVVSMSFTADGVTPDDDDDASRARAATVAALTLKCCVSQSVKGRHLFVD